MKAKTVYEGINFERGKDPRDSMNIGNKNARDFMEKQIQVKKNYADLAPFIEGSINPEDLDLRDINNKINSLIDAAEYIIIKYFNDKYDLELTPVYYEYRNPDTLFAESRKNGTAWKFFSNSSGAGIYIDYYDGWNSETSNLSYKIKTIEEKFLKIVKKFGVKL